MAARWRRPSTLPRSSGARRSGTSMIERMFALTKLSDHLDLDLQRLVGSVQGCEVPATDWGGSDVRDMGRSGSRLNRDFDLVPVHSSEESLLELVKAEVRARLPWRSLDDGAPVAMDVVTAGIVNGTDCERPPGTVFVTVVADSWDAADAIQVAFAEIGGLDEAEWVAGWERSDRGFRQISIFPPADLAA